MSFQLFDSSYLIGKCFLFHPSVGHIFVYNLLLTLGTQKRWPQLAMTDESRLHLFTLVLHAKNQFYSNTELPKYTTQDGLGNN